MINSILVRCTLDFEMDSQCAVLEPGLSDPNQLIAERFHVNSLEAPYNLSAPCPGGDKSIYSYM